MSNATATVSPWVVWMWRYHSLSTYLCETRGEAIRLAIGIADDGAGSLECIEGPDGSLVSQEEIDAIEEEQWKAVTGRIELDPIPTHFVKVVAPNGKDTTLWGSHFGEEAAESEAAVLRERFGAERVKVTNRR